MQIRKIHSLAGLKVIAILLIFWWHSWLPNPPCDLGARCCEFFFVASGFLVYYTHKGTFSCTWRDSLQYVRKKLVTIYPMHLLGFILVLFSMSLTDVFSKSTLIRGITNLLLLQSWINIEQVFFSFNGPSWFLSSLLFCYFLTPVLLRLIRNRRKVWVYFPVVFLIRYAIEELQFYYPNSYFDFNIHVSPFLRMMEFFLGVMTGCIWNRLYDLLQTRLEKASPALRFGLFSILELLTLSLTAGFMVSKQNSWGRAVFTLWFCAVVLVFAFDGGIISSLCATKPMKWLSGLQFEIFLFHIPVIQLVSKYILAYNLSAAQFAGIALVIVILLSIVYRRVLKKPAEQCFGKLLDRIYSWVIS